jgi:hypothetical protein
MGRIRRAWHRLRGHRYDTAHIVTYRYCACGATDHDVRPQPPPSTAADVERDRVLRHPDIAARLCDPPLRYSRPENWTGYVPPETWQGKRNDAPQRTQLLDIITAAVKREKEAQGV